jgi:hypothetical protein
VTYVFGQFFSRFGIVVVKKREIFALPIEANGFDQWRREERSN